MMLGGPSHIDLNEQAYRRRRVVDGYQKKSRSGLFAAERYCLDLLPSSRRGSILDIGIGGGRTTGPLSDMFAHYVGIDYSPEMIDAARLEYPDKDLQVMDARRLQFDMQFDCVMFSHNGIDYTTYEDRQLVLKQIASLLRQGGFFIYSTHNLGFPGARIYFSNFFVKQMFRTWRSPIFGMPNRIRNFWKQTIDEARGIAYINDNAHAFSLLHVYVDIAKELENLRCIGFSNTTTFGIMKDSAVYDADDEWVYIAAQKP